MRFVKGIGNNQSAFSGSTRTKAIDSWSFETPTYKPQQTWLCQVVSKTFFFFHQTNLTLYIDSFTKQRRETELQRYCLFVLLRNETIKNIDRTNPRFFLNWNRSSFRGACSTFSNRRKWCIVFVRVWTTTNRFTTNNNLWFRCLKCIWFDNDKIWSPTFEIVTRPMNFLPEKKS